MSIIDQIEVFVHTTSYSYENAIDYGCIIYTVRYTNGTHEEIHVNQFRPLPPKFINDFISQTDLFIWHEYNRRTTDFPDLNIYTQSQYITYSKCPF